MDMDSALSGIGLRSATIECCSQLTAALGSVVSLPGTTGYNATIASYFSIQESSLTPSCIVVPETPQDVSTAVKILASPQNECKFAIKGRSHMPGAGFANINDGVTIDMTKLSSVSVNDDHTVASVGAGAAWLDVYQFLDPLGLSVAGGRNGLVGVGGLSLGGGISYFAPRVGWACDNIVNAEVVLASGELVNVNASSNSDLLKALKGGSNNFGVVTRFDLATFPQGPIVAGSLSHPITEREAVFKAFTEIADAPDYDIYASLVTGFLFASANKQWSIGSTPAYTKPDLNASFYDPLTSIPNVGDTRQITNLSIVSNENNTPPLNWAFFTGTYGVSAPLMSQIFDTLNNTIYPFDIPGNITWSIAFEPLPTVITKFGAEKGGNSLGTDPSDGNAFVMLLSPLWPSTESNPLVISACEKMMTQINELAHNMGLLHKFQYINYADPSQDPIRNYGENNVRHLRRMSKKYDPRGVFQRLVPGGFKIPGL
ncbi:FAD binding domain protein [Xylogone sp. PMI_703]|nr:FAD binding domain protein [Xylogone sp. PMI_703]